MEGYLSMPPERSALIGKAGWKARYVVLGPDPRTSDSPDKTASSKSSRSKPSRHGKKTSKDVSRPQLISGTGTICLTVYKQRGDRDPLSSYPVNKMQQCNIESTSQGRGGDSSQVLSIVMEPEKPSSRRDKPKTVRPGKNLVFRNSSDRLDPSVFDWYQTLQTYRSGLDSPKSTGSWGMLAEDDRPNTSNTNRSSSRNGSHSRNLLSVNGSSASGRTRGSMRSTPSAASSRPSSNNRRNGGRTPDISPAAEDQTPVARPHILDRIQAVSNVAPVSKPMPPQESILDRAFTLNYIPYQSSLDSDSESDDDESHATGISRLRSPSPSKREQQQTSIARIEALMRRSSVNQSQIGGISLNLADPRPPVINPPGPIPSPTQRAIDFISSRPPPAVAKTPTKGSSASRARRRPERSSPPKYPPSSTRREDQAAADWRRLSIISAASSSGYSYAAPAATSAPKGNGAVRRTAAAQDLARRLSSTSSLMLAHARENSYGSSEMISLDGSENLSVASTWDLEQSVRDSKNGCLSARPMQVPVWGSARGTMSGGVF